MAEDAEPYRQLPEPVRPEDMVEEVDVSIPPAEPVVDPNQDDAVRLGLMGGAG